MRGFRSFVLAVCGLWLFAPAVHAQSSSPAGIGATSSFPFAPGDHVCWADTLGHPAPCGNTTYLPAPTIAAGTGAGTGPTIAVAGTDLAFTVTLTEGTSPTAGGPLATITMGSTHAASPRCVIEPANVAAAALASTAQPFSNPANGSTTTIVMTSGGTALTAATAYAWNGFCGP